MSVLGTWRASGVNATSGSIFSDRIINITGFQPSGITGGNLVGVGLFVYSGTIDCGYWVPLKREWL